MPLSRTLRRGGGFAIAMILLLALGIGATTAMFSVVNGVLLAPLSLHDPGQLVLLGETYPEQPAISAKFAYFVNPTAFATWRRDASSFSAMSAIQSDSIAVAHGGQAELWHGARVSSNFFSMLGVRPRLGRAFVASDASDTTHPILITDQLWRSEFGSSPAVIGEHIGAGNDTARIIGVLPASFHLAGRSLGPMLAGEPTQYFEAFQLDPKAISPQYVFTDFNYHVIARLQSGVSVETAQAQLNGIQRRLGLNSPDKTPLGAQVTPVRDYTVVAAQSQLWLLFGGVLAVLLVVCVNLGGLWVTRIADRRRDWAIRAALGAAPSRLVREVLRESVVLALIGGGLGIACAAAMLRLLVASAPADIPRLDQVHLDWRVLLFGFGLSVFAGLITGLIPALRLSHADPQSALKASAAATTADRSSLRSRQSLIAVQAALSTLLLAGAGLLGLSFYRLLQQPTGFNEQHALAANVMLNAYSPAQRLQLLRRLPAAAAAIPGVTTAAVTSHLPLQGETWVDGAGLIGKTYPADAQPTVNVRFISGGYFSTLGIPLLRGRSFAPSDENAKPPRVVISRATAVMLWPDLARDPGAAVGKEFAFNGKPAQVIGVADDARTSLRAAPPAVVYQPSWEWPTYNPQLVVRSALPTAALVAPLRRAIWNVAPLAPIPKLRALADLKAQAVAPQRYQLTLLLLFAAIALILAAIGVYALVAHSVARRAKELAIRITMGARASDVWGLIVRQALAPVLAGVLAGLIAAVLAGRALAALLFEVHPASPQVLAAVAAAVLLAALLACLWPAHRATRTDPLSALRAE